MTHVIRIYFEDTLAFYICSSFLLSQTPFLSSPVHLHFSPSLLTDPLHHWNTAEPPERWASSWHPHPPILPFSFFPSSISHCSPPSFLYTLHSYSPTPPSCSVSSSSLFMLPFVSNSIPLLFPQLLYCLVPLHARVILSVLPLFSSLHPSFISWSPLQSRYGISV